MSKELKDKIDQKTKSQNLKSLAELSRESEEKTSESLAKTSESEQK